MTPVPLTASSLRPYLLHCGYADSLLLSRHDADLLAFAHLPLDSRSACIAVLDVPGHSNPQAEMAKCKSTGAPVVFACYQDTLEWWKQGASRPERVGPRVAVDGLVRFFRDNAPHLSPAAIYRAKTWGRFDRAFQLSFVDLGLMPLIEEQVGQELDRLIERNVALLKRQLRWNQLSEEQGRWLLKSIFWLVSGKILRDKRVSSFHDLDLTNVGEVLERVSAHLGGAPIRFENARQKAALAERAAEISAFADLSLTTTEALAHVYENTLVSKEIRTDLGTHSTPTYLVDYVIGRLASAIAEIPAIARNVFEPACGHAAFLAAAMRLLTELFHKETLDTAARPAYLRDRIHGCDNDPFALEIARLTLTLADIPNPNGWDLRQVDMFRPGFLETASRSARIFLANPPFNHFTTEERQRYFRKGVQLHNTKAAELLHRTLPHLPGGSVFGIVMPQAFLEEKNSADIRRVLLRDFHVEEVLLFPGRVFNFSEAESAVLIGRRVSGMQKNARKIIFTWVRERDLGAFRRLFQAPEHDSVLQDYLFRDQQASLLVPQLKALWDWCDSSQSLADIGSLASIGQGLFFKGKELPPGAVTSSASEFPGGVSGFCLFPEGIMLHELPGLCWLNLSPSVVDRTVAGGVTDAPQVLLNYGRTSRGLWRLKALLDYQGHPVSNRFITVRLSSPEFPIEFFWAILNSPIANAFAYSHLVGRDNKVGVLRRVPVPKEKSAAWEIAGAAKRYLEVARAEIGSMDYNRLTSAAMSRLDALIIETYAFPPVLERRLLEFCAGFQRGGVPFEFTSYYPSGFDETIKYKDLLAITLDWEKTNDRRNKLIDRDLAGELTEADRYELQRLQTLADSRMRLVAGSVFNIRQ